MFAMLPEILIILTAFAVLILDLFCIPQAASNGNRGWLVYVALTGILAATVATAMSLGQPESLFGGRFEIDPLSQWFKVIFLGATALTLTFSPEPFGAEAKQPIRSMSEFFTVLLFTLSGMMFLISSRDLVSLYVSLELATIPLIALTAWTKSERAGEGALKYMVMGALASAALLYGFGLLYVLSGGQMSLAEIAAGVQPSKALWLAAGLVLAGVSFKLTLVPFHMWAPDAYEGAPTPVTAFLSVASKAAGLAVAFQLFYRVFGLHLPNWSIVIAVLATLTMTLGNVVAVLQSNLKRFMAFSAISQAGYLILGFLGNDGQAAASMVFYMFVYVVTNLAVFAVFVLHIHQTGEEDIASLRGLSRLNPLLGLAMMIALFGLAGIPPLSGFVGKFFLFSVAAKAGQYWLVGVAALNSTVSLYYYLRIIRAAYIESPQDGAVPLKVSPLAGVGLTVATLGSVFCGLIPFFYERMTLDAAEWLKLLAH
jgi:proton-translocating NADH-quinone oxidoreductase chain N